MLDSIGLTTPPTKLQTFFFGTGLSRIWIDAKNDIDAVRGHFHPLDQGPNHLALAEPVRVLQPRVELGCKVLQASNNQTDFRLKGRHIKELLALLLQLRETLAQAGNAGFELVLFQQPLGVAVNQPREPLGHLPELRLKRGLDLVRPSGRGLYATLIFFGYSFWMRQYPLDFPPHGHIQE